jgi:hypothetical protein
MLMSPAIVSYKFSQICLKAKNVKFPFKGFYKKKKKNSLCMQMEAPLCGGAGVVSKVEASRTSDR